MREAQRECGGARMRAQAIDELQGQPLARSPHDMPARHAVAVALDPVRHRQKAHAMRAQPSNTSARHSLTYASAQRYGQPSAGLSPPKRVQSENASATLSRMR